MCLYNLYKQKIRVNQTATYIVRTKCCRKSTASSRPFSPAGKRPCRKGKCNQRTQGKRYDALGSEDE